MLTSADFYRDRTLNIAHRGARKQAPENTLPAFERALDLGADGIELDVMLSSDSVPVVIHDPRVDNLTNGSGLVADMPLAQLKELDAGSSFGPEFAGTRIPALSEVLETFGSRTMFNIELKSNGAEALLVERVAEMVHSFDLAETVLISSFNLSILEKVRAAAPEIPVGYLFAPSPVSRLNRLLNTPCDALHPHHRLVTRRFVRTAHQNGYRVNVWTVNKPRDIRRMLALNVDMIINDSPGLVKDALAG